MKKSLLLGLVSLGAASMLCGFDSAETADSVLTKMQEASTAETSMTMDMSFNADAAINISDGTTNSSLALAASGNYKIDYIMDPLAMVVDGNVSVSTFGQGQDIKMKMYMVTKEDGTMDSYTYTEDSTTGESGWSHEASAGIDMNQIQALSSTFDANTLAEYGMTYELASAADVNGTECYELTTVIDEASLETMFSKLSETTGEDLMSQAGEVLTYLQGLKLNVSYYVDTTTYLPVSVHLDMNGSDLSSLNTILGAALGMSEDGTTAELVLNDVSMDGTFSYGNVTEITVPDEAIAAVAAGETESADALVSDVTDALAVETELATEAVAE